MHVVVFFNTDHTSTVSRVVGPFTNGEAYEYASRECGEETQSDEWGRECDSNWCPLFAVLDLEPPT